MDPPAVPPSPQQSTADVPGFKSSPVLRREMALTIQSVHAVTINRERMSLWYQKLRERAFGLLPGFFVRCRVEDTKDGRALYKIGRLKRVKPDWSVELDLLTTEEIRSGINKTSYDCISNAKLSVEEYEKWMSRLPPEDVGEVLRTIYHAEERFRMIETYFLGDHAIITTEKKKGDRNNTANSGSAAPEKFTYSQNVLLCEDNYGVLPQMVTIVDLLQNTVGNGCGEPDTPRAGQSPTQNSRKNRQETVASHSTMVQLQEMRAYANSPTQPPVDPARLIEIIRRASNETHTAFAYDNLPEFAKLIISVCNMCREVVAREPLFVHLKSPCTVFGDIHGNFADMAYFLEKAVAFDDIMLKYSIPHLLFLGDYVDRGAFSLECVMYLIALKTINPAKMTMLRGNHESPEVNGDIEGYGYGSFKYQCLEKFGRDLGMDVWIAVNEVFQYLPVIADIDKKIFCVHGGLPQYSGGEDRRLEILSDSSFPRIPVVQCADATNMAQRMMVNDLLWSDPAPPELPLDKYGFGPNPRGPDIKSFGSRAVDMFCERYNYQYIFRAHQEKADGLRLSDNARVVTIFSTSSYVGHQNGAGCIQVANGRIRMAIKKPRSDVVEPSSQLSPRSLAKLPSSARIKRR